MWSYSIINQLSDFGISCIVDKTIQPLTLKLMAFELLQENINCDNKADAYSFGAVFFFILIDGDLSGTNITNIRSCKKKKKIPDYKYEISHDLINCYSTSAIDRPSFKQIV